ncbi:MAG: YdcF family protein [Rhodospirillales bacterium]|jgi:uncharacterized SAM-binding protein YcdF (DUF218 family)
MTLVSVRRLRAGSRRIAALVFAAIFLLSAWVYGLSWFSSLIPSRVEDSTTHTEAIVILTGGSGRLDEGLKLLGEDLAGRLFVSGVYRGVDVDRLLDISRNTPQELACCIDIGHAASNTAGNAAETAEWARDNGIRSLRIVTSVYHLPRSLLEFSYAMPAIKLVPHPVFADHVKRDRWWLWPGTAKLIVGEYIKYLLAVARHGSDVFVENLTTI